LRVLIIGGTGYIGPPVVYELLSRGHEVTIFHRGETVGDLPRETRHVLGERRDLLFHRNTFRQLRIEVVVDIIAGARSDTKTFVDTFRGIAYRAVVLSSGDVYRAYDVFFRRESGPLEPTPLSEGARLRTRLYPFRGTAMPTVPWVNWDEYEKIDVEQEAQSAPELPTTILRLPMIYG
jgi:nucleoside-diphosphate-sugar epimerase